MRPVLTGIRRARKREFRSSRIFLALLRSRWSTEPMKRKQSLRFFTIRWKIAAAQNDCVISGKNSAMTSRGSLMVAPTPMKRQSRRGRNENKGTSVISRIPILRRGWCQPPTSCTTRARSWRSSEDMVWKCSNGLRGKRMEPFGITGRLSPRFASLAIMPISSTSSIGWSVRLRNLSGNESRKCCSHVLVGRSLCLAGHR